LYNRLVELGSPVSTMTEHFVNLYTDFTVVTTFLWVNVDYDHLLDDVEDQDYVHLL